jgi:hypothetical protein
MRDEIAEFSRQILSLDSRLDTMRAAIHSAEVSPPLTVALTELEACREELRVAEEELRVQQEHGPQLFISRRSAGSCRARASRRQC